MTPVTLILSAFGHITAQLPESRGEHLAVQCALLCDGSAIEAASEPAQLRLDLEEPLAGEPFVPGVSTIIGEVSSILSQLAAVGAQLTLVFADLLSGLRALHLRLGDLAPEVLVEGGVERTEPA